MTEREPIAVLGGGSFGTAIANLLGENGRIARLWMRDPEQAEQMRRERENPRYLKGIRIHDNVQPTSDLDAVLDACELIFVALPSSALRQALMPVAASLDGKMLVSTTKGIEAQGFKLMSQILEEIAPHARIGGPTGRSRAREGAAPARTARVIATAEEEWSRRVQEALHGRSCRVSASSGRFGVELGGALKNAYAMMS